MAEGIGYNDIMRMQSEAAERVKKMREQERNAARRARSQGFGAHTPEESKHTFHEPVRTENRHSGNFGNLNGGYKTTSLPLDIPSRQIHEPHPEPPIRPEKPAVNHTAKPPYGDGSKFHPVKSENVPLPRPQEQGADMDYDRLLVLLLILILSKEQADDLLLMALGYLII